MTYQFVKVETADHITTVTINRPEVMNALHPPAHVELGQIFDEFDADDSAWVAIVTGEGEHAFSAGNDLKVTSSGQTFPGLKWKGGFGGLAMRYDLSKPV
ncbi:MAG: enoyl-CoA hydratase-related protein, partial [Acidobacteriota bacterium]